MFIKWNFTTAVATHLDTRVPESKLVAEWLTELSPSDPEAHRAFAVLLEKSFDANDFERSIGEYENAAKLSPQNYLMWLSLARARSRSGDSDGALYAISRALELAPNYANVQWEYGNFLVRQDRLDEGFSFIVKAAASNPQYSAPAAVLALQLFENNVERTRMALGGGEGADVALARVLASLKLYDDSLNAWSRLPGDLRVTKHKQLGEQLIEQMTSGNQFRQAARITADLVENEILKPASGRVVNGGFENEVKMREAGRFEWQIGEGTEPQIGLNEIQKHGGKYCLWIVFDTFDTAGFRQVSQIVAVEPGARYKFEAHYVSALKSASKLRFELVNAATGAVLAATSEMLPTKEWLPLAAEFTMPSDVDGLKIQLRREGCNGPACPVSGTLGVDDVSITRL